MVPLDTKVGLGPGDIELDGTQLPSKGAQFPQFSAHICCGQTAGWIETPLCTEVCLGPGHVVAQQPPLFGPRLLWPNSRPFQQLLSSCS